MEYYEEGFNDPASQAFWHGVQSFGMIPYMTAEPVTCDLDSGFLQLG